MKKKILISGAGVAGLSLALLLDRSKYDIEVIEKEQSFFNLGYSIILWDSGYRILQETVQDPLESHVSAIDSMSIYGGSETIKHIHTTDTSGVGYSIRRSTLIDLLSKKFISTFGPEKISFSSSVKNIEFCDNNTVSVTLKNDSTKSYDLVVAADGMYSKLRDMAIATKKQSGEFKITYAWIKPNDFLDKEALIGFCEGFTFLIQTIDDRSLLAYYTESNQHDEEEFIRKLVSMMRESRGGTLEIDFDSKSVFVAEEISVASAFRRQLILVGDAFHGHYPTLAMGTTMALEDSASLARALNESTDLEEAIRSYASERVGRVEDVYGKQRIIESLFVSTDKLKADVMETLLQHGGWFLLEAAMKKIISYSLPKETESEDVA